MLFLVTLKQNKPTIQGGGHIRALVNTNLTEFGMGSRISNALLLKLIPKLLFLRNVPFKQTMTHSDLSSQQAKSTHLFPDGLDAENDCSLPLQCMHKASVSKMPSVLLSTTWERKATVTECHAAQYVTQAKKSMKKYSAYADLK